MIQLFASLFCLEVGKNTAFHEASITPARRTGAGEPLCMQFVDPGRKQVAC